MRFATRGGSGLRSRRYEQIARPFKWKLTRNDLHKMLERLNQPTPQLQLAALTKNRQPMRQTTT